MQDGYGHAGASMQEHSLVKDVFGNKKSSQNITESAITVHKLMSGDWTNMGKTVKLDLTGMSDEQKHQVVDRLHAYINRK